MSHIQIQIKQRESEFCFQNWYVGNDNLDKIYI